MAKTIYQKFDKTKDREQLIEDFINNRLEEVGAVFGNSSISGLRAEWVSASSIRIGTGEADLPDKSRRLRLASPYTVSGISLGANKWGHAYLLNNAGTPVVEVISQDAATPFNYFGTAYRKASDDSRRYLCSVRTNAAGQILNFLHIGDMIFYRETLFASPLRVLTAGTATVDTTVPFGAVIPGTSRLGFMRSLNTSNQTAITSTSDGSNTIQAGYDPPPAGYSADSKQFLTLNASQELRYRLAGAAASGGFYLSAWGYTFER